MNTHDLEHLRKKRLQKVTTYSLVYLLAMVVCVVVATYTYAGNYVKIMSPFIIFCIWMVHLDNIAKNFEHTVKANCIDDVIAKILGERGKIKWVNTAKTCILTGALHASLETDCEGAKEFLKDAQETLEAENINLSDYQTSFNECIPFTSEIVSQSGLFGFDTCSEDDVFFGRYEGLNVRISEATLDRGSGRHSYTIFRGILVIVETKKPFEGQLLIGKGGHMQRRGLGKIQLPKDLLPQGFDAYTDNVKDAKQILSPSFCNILAGPKCKISASFCEGFIIMAIDKKWTPDMFKLGCLFREINDSKQYVKFVQEFNLALNAVDGLINTTNELV
jgi:hypothetical protein